MIGPLIGTLWQGAFIAATAFMVASFVPRRNAATRCAIWFSALIALALLPLAGLIPAPTSGSVLPVLRTTALAAHAADRAAAHGALWLALSWTIGALIGIARLTVSYVRIRDVVRSAVPAPQIGAEVVISDRIAVPLVAGFVRPRIVVPQAVAETLDATDMRGIVMHERAHIRRRDVIGNFIQRVIEALFFFNPWVYLIGRAIVLEREAACDDWAVHDLREPERYASCLARLAMNAGTQRAPLLTPSAVGFRRTIVGRIARLLNGKAKDVKTHPLVVSAAIGSFALLTLAFQLPRTLAATPVVAIGSANAPSTCNHGASAKNPVAPEIPASAMKAAGKSTATAQVTVSANGQPASAKIVTSSGNAQIDHATVLAAMHSTYNPAVKDCNAVAGLYLFRVSVAP